MFQADLRHVIYALSDALDLVGVDDVAHGKRVGIMAAECGKLLALPAESNTFLFDLGMLHDIGVSSTRTHRNLVDEFDWEGSQLHAQIGHALLQEFPPLAAMALPVLFHHTPWEKLQAMADVDNTIARQSNLIFLVDRVDALSAPYYSDGSLLLHKEAIRDKIRQRAGTYFAPDLVECFLETSRSEAFWLLLEPRSIHAYLQGQLDQGAHYQAPVQELKQLACIFSRIVDAKSPFTAQHSLGVSRLARFLAEQVGINDENCDKLEIAGLLHDLGKLRVPDEILDKPGKLDPRERQIINTHAFETFQILRNIEGFEEVTPWASYHHEEPGGTGYPFHLHAETLPQEARILRVADIFQAMVQDRPYRSGLSGTEALHFLDDLVSKQKLDADIVAVVHARLDQALAAALSAHAGLPHGNPC